MNIEEAKKRYKNSPMQGNVGTPAGAAEMWERAYCKGFIDGHSDATKEERERVKPLVVVITDIIIRAEGDCDHSLLIENAKEALSAYKGEEL